MKHFMKLAILLAVMLTFATLPTSAQQGVGSTPYVANLLSAGLNVGSLAPGQSFWYSFSRNDLGNPALQSVILNLTFKPGDSRTARRVTFDVYTFEQVKAFLEVGDENSPRAGTGQLVTADYSPDTAERLWAGTVNADEIYYVHVQNQSELTVDYRMTVVPQQNALPALPPTAIPAAATTAVRTTAAPPTLPAPPTLADSPDAQKWLLVTQAIQSMPPEQAAAWLKMAVEQGWLVPPEASAETVPAAKGAPTATTAAAAEPQSPAPPPDNSIYPTQPLDLLPRNVNRLAPHAEHWYTFLRDDLDNNPFEEMALTMFVTPGDGNITNRVNFQIFTGDQYPIWLRGTPDDMINTGAGQLVSRDGDPNTGERIWRGTIVDGDRYYIQVKNDSNAWVDYYLLTGDIINTELGDAPNPLPAQTSILPPERIVDVSVPAAPPGDTIANPLVAALGHNRGRLDAGEDVWFSFRFQNFDDPEPEIRRYTMYLRHTPGYGHIANHVNLELYTYPQLDRWLRGTPDAMTPMGVGSREEYDPKTNTQEFTWDGTLVSNTTYFLRVRNDSEAPIFFDLEIQWR